MASGFTDSYFKLGDGRTVRIRAMAPSDEAALLKAFERLSPEARYMRFMRVIDEPNMERVRKVLASFPESGLAIVAVAGGTEIVGSAMFLTGKDQASCEFATTVAGDYGGHGLDRALMTALIAAAIARGQGKWKASCWPRTGPCSSLPPAWGCNPPRSRRRIRAHLPLAESRHCVSLSIVPGLNPV